MNRAFVGAVAALLRGATAPAAAAFRRRLEDPRAAQRALARDLVADLAAADYGRHHGVRADDDLDDLRSRLPIATWDDLAPWLDRQRATGGAVLTARPVRHHEPTSGSGGPRKLVPYTDALLAGFARMFALWAHDLVARGPGFTTGRMYFSVSPGEGGFEDDGEYLPGPLRLLFRPTFVAPPSLKRLADPQAFRDALAFHLLAAADLEVVSVWSPSFLAIALDHAAARLDRLAPALRAGRMCANGFTFSVPPVAPERLAAAARGDWSAVWPALKLVSCWASGPSAPGAADLARRLPLPFHQGKGLLATEAPVTVPLLDAGGPAPLVDQVLIELEDAAGRLHLLDEVTDGAEYALVVTTRGGLWRYRIGDRVRVVGRFRGTPLLEFAGRADAVSDLVGEKLAEPFVAACLVAAAPPGQHTLVPAGDRYVLLSDRAGADPEALDRALAGAFHYAIARRNGQLRPVDLRVDPEWPARLVALRAARGQRLGDVKPPALVTRPEEAAALLGPPAPG